MADNLLFLIESEILPGKEAELREVVTELAEHTASTEPGTLRYDWFINTETQTVRLVEEYESFDAAMFHGENYRAFRIRLEDLRVVTSRTICGDVSGDAKAVLDLLQPDYFEPM